MAARSPPHPHYRSRSRGARESRAGGETRWGGQRRGGWGGGQRMETSPILNFQVSAVCSPN